MGVFWELGVGSWKLTRLIQIEVPGRFRDGFLARLLERLFEPLRERVAARAFGLHRLLEERLAARGLFGQNALCLRQLGAIASRWIDLVEEELGGLARDEKPWIRELTGRLVAFCREADRAPDVLFAWSLS